MKLLGFLIITLVLEPIELSSSNSVISPLILVDK